MAAVPLPSRPAPQCRNSPCAFPPAHSSSEHRSWRRPSWLPVLGMAGTASLREVLLANLGAVPPRVPTAFSSSDRPVSRPCRSRPLRRHVCSSLGDLPRLVRGDSLSDSTGCRKVACFSHSGWGAKVDASLYLEQEQEAAAAAGRQSAPWSLSGQGLDLRFRASTGVAIGGNAQHLQYAVGQDPAARLSGQDYWPWRTDWGEGKMSSMSSERLSGGK